MIVEQVWTGNAYRNFNYLVACAESGEALAIDPLEFRKCLDVAQERGWTITQILNTHEHADHTGGNKGVVNATGAKIIAHKDAGKRIPNMDRGVGAGDIIKVDGGMTAQQRSATVDIVPPDTFPRLEDVVAALDTGAGGE
mgnify:CR=1 FL=1